MCFELLNHQLSISVRDGWALGNSVKKLLSIMFEILHIYTGIFHVFKYLTRKVASVFPGSVLAKKCVGITVNQRKRQWYVEIFRYFDLFK